MVLGMGGVASGSEALGVNAQGDIVGWYAIKGGTTRGFMLHKGRWATLGGPPTGWASPTGINAQGDIVGWYDDSRTSTHGFLLHKGHWTTLDDPHARGFRGMVTTEAQGVNAQGDVVGWYQDRRLSSNSRSMTGSENTHGFLLHNGHWTTIDDPHAGPYKGYGLATTQPQGINARGDIVGWYGDRRGNTHGFLLHNGHWITLDAPHAGATQAQGINARGDVVGWYGDSHGMHGFVLHEGHWTTLDDPHAGPYRGVETTQAQGINAQGDIVGWYRDRSGFPHGFLLR
jgi:probable HAF family extracellular repeat protein